MIGRMSRIALVALIVLGAAGGFVGCGGSSSLEAEPGKPVPWLSGRAEIVSIQIGTVHTAVISLDRGSFSPLQLNLLGQILAGKPLVNGGKVVRKPERFQALCSTGYIPASVCP